MKKMREDSANISDENEDQLMEGDEKASLWSKETLAAETWK